jgi:protein-disulfide isomerase
MKVYSRKKNNNVLIALLSHLGVKYTYQYADKLFNEHPHKYNLFGLSKMLSNYNVENTGVKISNKTEAIHELEIPFIAHIGSDFIVVYKITTEKVFYIWNKKDLSVSIEEFCKMWTGIILYTEPDENSIEPDYNAHREKEVFISVQKIALFTAMLLALIVVFVKNDLYKEVVYYLLATVSLAGIYVGYLLILKQMHIYSEYADKICSLFSKSDCNNVLESDAAKLGGVIGWSEIGLGYFVTNTLITICVPGLLSYMALINILALPYTVWSIWYQKFKANQWCPLCLIVQLLLWSIFLINLLFGVIHISGLNMTDGLLVGFLYLIPMLFINMLIPSLGKNKNEERVIQELNSLKADERILAAFLKKQPKYAVDKSSSGILFGNPNANILVTILSNPHCGPCAHMHTRVEKLLSENKNICVQYIMSYFDSLNLEISNKFLMAAYFNNEEKDRITIYNTWFEGGKYKKDLFIKDYNLNLEEEKVLQEFEKHNVWKEQSGLNATPTIMVNGYILPNNYKVEDLRYITDLDVDSK